MRVSSCQSLGKGIPATLRLGIPSNYLDPQTTHNSITMAVVPCWGLWASSMGKLGGGGSNYPSMLCLPSPGTTGDFAPHGDLSSTRKTLNPKR